MYKRYCNVALSINSKCYALFFTNAFLAENKLTPAFLLSCFVTLLLSFFLVIFYDLFRSFYNLFRDLKILVDVFERS